MKKKHFVMLCRGTSLVTKNTAGGNSAISCLAAGGMKTSTELTPHLLMEEILHQLDVKNLVNNGIFTISAGAGFQPSTVPILPPQNKKEKKVVGRPQHLERLSSTLQRSNSFPGMACQKTIGDDDNYSPISDLNMLGFT